MQDKSIVEFYNDDAISYAAYDNTRKLCSYIDGLKISQRKILYTIRKKFSNDFGKTESIANTCASDTQYLHGAANLVGVASLMAQDFVGSNNFPILKGNSGGFGTRINPVYAAGRYTRLTLSRIAKLLIDKEDEEILFGQIFEGDVIEPKFFVPIFPTLFLNGSSGLSTGFTETVYPRNPLEIIKYIKSQLENRDNNKDGNNNSTSKKSLKSKTKLLPWFRGFAGKVSYNNEDDQIECTGIIERTSRSTQFVIRELPIGTEYQQYVEFLNSLCDDGTIINYTDCCDTKNDKILFNIQVSREFSKKYSKDESLLKVFKLKKKLNESLCFMNEFNSVKEFNDIYEVLDEYIKIRYDFYIKRKQYIISKLENELRVLISKMVFCNSIITKKLVISSRAKADIVEDLKKIDKIITIDGNYDYLLRMPISQITKEEILKLKSIIESKSTELHNIKTTTETDMWRNDLKEIEKFFKDNI